MFCGKCGKEVKNTVAFCPFCVNEITKEREEPTYKKAVVDRESREEAQEKKVKKTVPLKLVWKYLAAGIGVLCFVTIGVVGYQQIVKMKNNQTKEKGTQAEYVKDATGKDAEKTDNWQLFQSEDSVIPLTEEEQEWILLQLEKFAKGKDRAAWEENLLTFQVLGQAAKEENRVSVDVICCTHPVEYTQFTTKVQYIKVTFSCEQEPDFADIEFKVCDNGENLFTKAKASSACEPQRNMVSAGKELSYYTAGNVVDDKEDTAWIEGVKGCGKGEWISLSSQTQQKICGIPYEMVL